MAALAVASVAAQPSGVALDDPGPAEWVRDLYVWQVNDEFLDASEDGGRTWRHIFPSPADEGVTDFAQTGPRTGIVSLDTFESSPEWWTRDNRHWFPTSVVGAPHDMRGHDSYLFTGGGSKGTAYLWRITPWPPTGDFARCRGRFLGERVPRVLRCFAGAKKPLRRTLVARVQRGYFTVIANAPGGAVALVYGAEHKGPFLRVVIHRYGRTEVSELPPIAVTLREKVGRSQEVLVSWPSIAILGYAPRSEAPSVVWTSSDGGSTWGVTATE